VETLIMEKTNNHSSIINNHLLFGIFTFVESALQNHLSMQNKPNFRKSQMNVNKVLTKDYENETLSGHGKNKPNSKPIKANTNPIKANIMPKQTQYEPNQTQFQRQKNAALHLFAVGYLRKKLYSVTV